MSDLSKLIHALKARSVADAGSAIRDAITHLKGYIGAAPVDAATSSAEHKIEDVKAALEAAYRVYLEGKLGKEFGDMAASLADTGVNALVSSLEGVLHGAANTPAQ